MEDNIEWIEFNRQQAKKVLPNFLGFFLKGDIDRYQERNCKWSMETNKRGDSLRITHDCPKKLLEESIERAKKFYAFEIARFSDSVVVFLNIQYSK